MTSIELHILQNFPPSNLNRDDTGQPKDADFGGYRRARISSQCLKRATRYAGEHEPTSMPPLFQRLTEVPLAKRTHLIVEERLLPQLRVAGKPEEEARQVAIEFAKAYSGKMDQKKPQETAVLLYLAESEVENIVRRLLALDWTKLLEDINTAEAKRRKKSGENKDSNEDKKKGDSPLKSLVDDLIKSTSQRTGAPDIALFGRMLADKPATNVDAACQVAHAISTHSIAGRTPIDYFTAVDDLKAKDDPGAGYLDVAYFNSACFYRYARIDFEQLKANLMVNDDRDLQDLARRSVRAFLQASERAIPGGKKNAFAQECRPSFMLAVLRTSDSPGWSLVNAFQRPVDAVTEGDLVVASARRLQKLFNHLIEFYGDESIITLAVALPDGLVTKEDLDPPLNDAVMNMEAWLDAICTPLGRRQENHP